jgi:hypothetical protein
MMAYTQTCSRGMYENTRSTTAQQYRRHRSMVSLLASDLRVVEKEETGDGNENTRSTASNKRRRRSLVSSLAPDTISVASSSDLRAAEEAETGASDDEEDDE